MHYSLCEHLPPPHTHPSEDSRKSRKKIQTSAKLNNKANTKLQEDIAWTQRKKGAKVCINVSGTIYETYLSNLERYPSTLLGDARRRYR